MRTQKRFQPRAVFRVAMVVLLAFFAMTIMVRSWSGLSVDIVDGVRGALLGVVLGLLVVVRSSQRRISADR